MNYFNETEKSLKRYLKTKVKITMATVVGFLIAGTVAFGATYDGEYTNKDIAELGSSKFVTGKDGNLTIQTNGSAYLLLKDLKNAKSLNDIRAALAQNGLHGSYVDENNQGNYVITGALAGQGRYSNGVKELQDLGKAGNKFLKNPTLDKILGVLERTNTNDGTEIIGDTNTVIGSVDRSSSPVVLGLIGGDMVVGVGKIDVDTSGLILDRGATITSSKEKENLTITRNGNSTVTLESGNLFGGSVGSTAISLGNIGVDAKLEKTINFGLIKITAKVIADLDLDGNSTANINGNTTLNINGTSNAAGVTAGGLATAIGGTATSNVNGNTTININSIVDGGQHIDGITAGIFGGGMAISTLRGTANANTTGKTEINVERGLSVGLVGGGLAVATDASQYIKDSDGTLDGTTTIVPDGLPPMTISGLNDGGTSTVKSGNVDINLSGDSSAAVVLGSGVAISHQNSPQGKDPTENDKISTSTVDVGNINIVVNVNKNIGENKEEIPAILTAIKGIIKKENLVNNMQTIIANTKDKGIVFGVAGNGIAMGADKGVSTVSANNTNIDLQNGYVVGVLGNGISTGNAWVKSTTEVKEKAKIDINGAEVIGVAGNGMAIYYGAGNYNGSLGFDGKVITKVKDSEINVNKGSVDGLFGGGIAIDDSQVDKTNAEAVTSGTSTINVTGGYVKDFGYEHLNGIMGTTAPDGTQDIKAYYKEVTNLGDGVAIFGGGVAAGNMAKVSVANSVINISGSKIDGDIVAGGIATAGSTSIVENSTIKITGGEINGSLYGQGKATKLDAPIGSVTDSGVATVTNSNLVIDGYEGKINSINDFHNIEIGKATNLETNSISVIGKADGTRGVMKNDGVIKILPQLTRAGSGRTLVTLVDSDLTNNGTLGVYAGDMVSTGSGETKNTGKIQILDKTAEELKDIDVSTLFGNGFTSTGMLVDKNGKVALDKDAIVIGNKDLTTENVNENDGAYLASGVTISGENPINTKSLNIIGNVTTEVEVKIDSSTINIADNGMITLGDSSNLSDLTISSAVVNGNSKEDSTDVIFGNTNSSLTLDSTKFYGTIGNNKADGTLNSLGNSLVDGNITVNTINIGKTEGGYESRLDLALNTKIDTNTININKDGQLGLVIDNQGNNAIKGTSGITINGQVGDTGDISIITGNLDGEDVVINIGDNTFNDVDAVTDSDLYILENKDITGAKEDNIDTELVLKYNDNYFEGNSILNNIHMAARDVSSYFSSDKTLREQEMDILYAENIYSETVRATYDTVKLNERLILGTNINSEVGKWTAVGNGVYNKNRYDKSGTLGKDYRTEIETSGLMGVMEYGLSTDSSVGVVLSGALQDVDADGGSADGTLLYLGTYAKKNIGNYRLIAGLGYQYGDYDADNTAAKIDSSASYKTNALSAYIEGRYSMDLGDNLAIEPKLKLGYTYVDQDDVKDAYFGVEDANISTFDAEIGADLVKSVNLKDGKLDVVFGASYVRAMGDTDKEFTGSFRAENGRNKFDVIGVNLPENTGKFDLSVEVSKDNGLFYNTGVFLQTGSNDTRNYGVNVGIGYRF